MINFQDKQLDVFYVSSPSLVSMMTFSCSNTGVLVPPKNALTYGEVEMQGMSC